MATTAQNKEELKKENTTLKKELKAQKDALAQLQEQMAALMSQIGNNVQVQQATPVVANNGLSQYGAIENYDDIVIRPDRYIPVMSLCSMGLMLSAGNGKFYDFHQYGDVQNIVYADLMEIVRNHRNLALEGAFYILNDKVVAAQGLKTYYDKILDKKALDELLMKDANEFEAIFTQLTNTQKDTIIQNVVEGVVNGQNISVNITSVINAVCKTNVESMIEEYKHFEETVKEMENEK